MRTNAWMRGMAAVALGVGMLSSTAIAQNDRPDRPARPSGRAGGDNMGDRDLPGPIDSLQDLQDSGKAMFKLADANNDGQISQKEAVDAANLIVGGFFFRADANGDGTLSQDEARQARESLLSQKPLLRVILQRAKRPEGAESNPARGLANLLDGNNDKQLQASELRQAVQTGVQGLYAAADTNRDGQMSPAEVNAALAGAARSAAQAAFEAADDDKNGALSQAEFEKAIVEPARTVFRVIDANGDGQLSAQEAQRAQRVLGNQIRNLRVPEPANSPGRMIESGRAPVPSAPIPSFGTAPQPREPERETPAPAPRGAVRTIPAPAPVPVQP